MQEFDFTGSGLPPLVFEAELPAGDNNQSYVYAARDKTRYVVRQKKRGSETGPLLGERNMLLFLADAGVAFAPRSHYFDAAKGFHVIGYAGGRDIRLAEFDAAQAEIFARQLAQLHEIPLANYTAWCAARNIRPAVPETLDKSLEIYFMSRIALVRDKCPDKVLAKWAGETAVGWLSGARSRPPLPATLVHGDLGGNMKLDGESLVFLDWERARFLHLGELGLIFSRYECPLPIQTRIMAVYAEARGLNLAQVQEQAEFEMRLQRVEKVLWNAAKFTRLAEAGDADAARSRDFAHAAAAELN